MNKIIQQTMNEVNGFFGFVKEISEEKKIDNLRKLYSYKGKENIKSFFIEVEKEVFERIKTQMEEKNPVEQLSIRIHPYKQKNELRIYFEEQYIGYIDVERKEIILFQTEAELDYAFNYTVQRYGKNIEYLDEEINGIHEKRNKTRYRLQKWLTSSKKNDSYYEEYQRTVNESERLKEEQEKLPETFKVKYEKINRIKPFMEMCNEFGFKIHEEEEQVYFQIFKMYGGGEHNDYLKSVPHIEYRNLFGMRNSQEKRILLEKEEMYKREHEKHMRPLMFFSRWDAYELLNDDVEIIHLQLLDKEKEEVMNEILFGLRNKEKSLNEYQDIRRIVFRYKGHIYHLFHNGLIVCSKEAKTFIIEEIKREEEELDRYLTAVIQDF